MSASPPPSRLRVRSGYRLSVSQFTGSRPVGSIGCAACTDYDVPVDVPVSSDPTEIGEAINAAVAGWVAHHEQRHSDDATIGMPHAQAPSAYPDEEG